MLEQIIFRNFKSYKEETILSFIPADIKEHSEELIEKNDGYELLPVAVLYGPNGGGKSNVLESIVYLRSRIMRPIFLMQGKLKEKDNDEKTIYSEHTFKFDEHSNCMPTLFKLLFSVHGRRYFYELEVECDGKILHELLGVDQFEGENLYSLFERKGKDISISEELAIPKLDNINAYMPFLSYVKCNYDNDVITDVVNWFDNICILDFNNPFRETYLKFFNNDKKKRMIVRLLNAMDINISDILIDYTPQKTIKQVYTIRKVGKEQKRLKIEEESGGTRKLFSFLPELLTALSSGSLVVADELDAKLHPKLLERIIRLFTDMDNNKRGAQLLMTSHDLVTMNLDVFRRDEIWFAASDDNFSSHLYSLVEFKMDKNSNIVQDYLTGRYGADPYFRQMVSFKEW